MKKNLYAAVLLFFVLFTLTAQPQNPDSIVIKPFKVNVKKYDLLDLKKRIKNTRYPDQEKVIDQSQGVKLTQIRQLMEYWGNTYDWRKAESRLNALPQFVTLIDGIEVHFIHVKSKHKGALPLLITHGWPGSVFEVLKAINPLTDPTKYSGQANDAFDVIIPSMPGYGFSGIPQENGWGPERIGKVWDILMKRLGYNKYVIQGGDWGSVIGNTMGRQAPEGLLGMHLNMPATVPPMIADVLKAGGPKPYDLTDKESAAFQSLQHLYVKGSGYAGMMISRPQTLGYGLNDSPVALASFFLDKFNEWTYSGGNALKVLTYEEILDDITLYWLTGTATSSARLYWENNNNNFNALEQKTNEIKIPVAITVFPGEIYQAPKSWAEQSYKNLIYFNEVNKGGHFASWEEPQLYSEELRKAFRSLR